MELTKAQIGRAVGLAVAFGEEHSYQVKAPVYEGGFWCITRHGKLVANGFENEDAASVYMVDYLALKFLSFDEVKEDESDGTPIPEVTEEDKRRMDEEHRNRYPGTYRDNY